MFIDGQLVRNIHSGDCYQVVGHVFMMGSSWMIVHEVVEIWVTSRTLVLPFPSAGGSE